MVTMLPCRPVLAGSQARRFCAFVTQVQRSWWIALCREAHWWPCSATHPALGRRQACQRQLLRRWGRWRSASACCRPGAQRACPTASRAVWKKSPGAPQARRTGVALLLQRAFAALFACGMCWALRGRRHGHGCETASGRSKQGAEITTWPGLVAIAFTVNIYIFREQLHLASVLRPAIVVQ